MKYKYDLMMDGNGRYFIRRRSWTWIFGSYRHLSSGRFDFRSRFWENPDGYDPQPPLRFADLREAISELQAAQNRDRESQNAEEVTKILTEE